MSVLIKGMKMPKNCKECPFCKWSNHYQIYVCFDGTRYTEIFFDGKHPTESALRSRRADNCPMTELPEQHGRLGDLDAMAFDESEAYMSAQAKLGRDVITTGINSIVHRKIQLLIMDTPTVIEAEGESE